MTQEQTNRHMDMLVRRIKSVLKGVDRFEVAMACAAVVIEALAQLSNEQRTESRDRILEALTQDWNDNDPDAA